MVAAATAAGASGAALARLTATEQALELVAATGISETAVQRWRLQSIDDESPLAEAVRLLQPVFARGGLLPGELDTGSAVALPLTVEGHPVGVLGLDYAAARTFGEAEHERFESLAASTAGAFDRAVRRQTGNAPGIFTSSRRSWRFSGRARSSPRRWSARARRRSGRAPLGW